MSAPRTRTTSESPAANPRTNNPAAAVAKPNDASRRAKKRELDRRAQRVARERVKSRIAYLEGVVQEFQREDSSGQVASLMAQLEKVEKERAQLAKTLGTVADLVRSHGLLKTKEEQEDDVVERKPMDNKGGQQMSDAYAGLIKKLPDSRKGSGQGYSEQLPTPRSLQGDVWSSQWTGSDKLQSGVLPTQPHIANTSIHMPEPQTSAERLHSHNNWQRGAAPLVQVQEFEGSESGACCLSDPDQTAVNLWRYANETLLERAQWEDAIVQDDQNIIDDTPIRAVLDGWDAVEKLGHLTPAWSILRRIDEALFCISSKTDRIAVLRVMHLLLCFHSEPTPARCAELPTWYLKRPSQTIAHSYAINFFVWPGLRERFVFFQHRYCSNLFWKLFATSLRLQWPFEVRDCYTRNTETGFYKISPLFNERISDIRTWTMGPDIFQHFPELYSDIPAVDQIPASVCNITQHRLLNSMPTDADAETSKSIVGSGGFPDMNNQSIALEPLLATTSYLPEFVTNLQNSQTYDEYNLFNRFAF